MGRSARRQASPTKRRKQGASPSIIRMPTHKITPVGMRVAGCLPPPRVTEVALTLDECTITGNGAASERAATQRRWQIPPEAEEAKGRSWGGHGPGQGTQTDIVKKIKPLFKWALFQP